MQRIVLKASEFLHIDYWVSKFNLRLSFYYWVPVTEKCTELCGRQSIFNMSQKITLELKYFQDKVLCGWRFGSFETNSNNSAGKFRSEDLNLL